MSTVFRLPEEPPVGATVEPANGIGLRHKRLPDDESTWQAVGGYGAVRSWGALLDKHPEGLVVVEPDPHPTPWTVGPWPSKTGEHAWSAQDATGCPVMETSSLDVAMRIVDAVNKAATT